jgi:hypothetical protein
MILGSILVSRHAFYRFTIWIFILQTTPARQHPTRISFIGLGKLNSIAMMIPDPFYVSRHVPL